MTEFPEYVQEQLSAQLDRMERTVRNRICQKVIEGSTLDPQEAIQAWVEVAEIQKLRMVIAKGNKVAVSERNNKAASLTPPGEGAKVR
jgi:hypothetical protein